MILDWIFPRRCLLCHIPGDLLCPGCAASVPVLPKHRCQQCAIPLSEYETDICNKCLMEPPPYDTTAAVFYYADPLTVIIQGMKYKGKLAWAEALATLWLAQWDAYPERPQALIPMPLHRKRMATRGYNQSKLIAEYWAKPLQAPIHDTIVTRSRETEVQANFRDDEARAANVEGAFTVKREVPEHVAIVDDVMTSGATVAALARALKEAGAKRVDVYCLARAIKQEDE